jgi:predicted deacylase
MRYYFRKMSGTVYRLPLFVLMCLYNTTVLPQNSIEIGNVKSNRSEKLSGSFNVAIGARGPEIEVPFVIINGAGKGPVIALTAGVNEYNNSPYQALQQIKDEFDPEHLSGTVVILHMVTTPSMLKRKIYHNPLEGLNMHRVYPGKSTGSIGERITYCIREEIIEKSDYLIDIQCQKPDEDLVPFTTCPIRGNPFVAYKTRDLAYNFGFGIIINDHYSPDNSNATILFRL